MVIMIIKLEFPDRFSRHILCLTFNQVLDNSNGLLQSCTMQYRHLYNLQLIKTSFLK